MEEILEQNRRLREEVQYLERQRDIPAVAELGVGFACTFRFVKTSLSKKTYTKPNPMNDFFPILLSLVATLAVPVFFIQFRRATEAQRRQILFAAVGAVVLAVGMLCFFKFR